MELDLIQRFYALRRRIDAIDPPNGGMLLTAFRDEQTSLFNECLRIMLDVAEHRLLYSGLSSELAAIETKIGIDNSDDPFSIDYRLRMLEGGEGD